MPLTVNWLQKREERVIHMGRKEPDPPSVAAAVDDLTASLGTFQQAIENATSPDPSPEPTKNKRGRPKKTWADNEKEGE